jgi:hypothetical protein
MSFQPHRRMFDTGILTIAVGLQDQNQIGDLKSKKPGLLFSLELGGKTHSR